MKLVFIHLFILAPAWLLAQTGEAEKKNTYSKDGYSISYPSGWTLDTTSKMGTLFFIFSPKENEEDKFYENVNLITEELTGTGIDLAGYAELSEKNIRTMATEAQIFESKKIVSGDGEYQKVIFSMKQGIFHLKTEQYYFIRNNKAYVLTYTAEIDKFDKFITTGEEILGSFRLGM